MRPLDKRYKVQAESLPEIRLGLAAEAMRLANPPTDLRHGDRPLTYGPLFLRFICYCMSLPIEEREIIVGKGGRILERHMAADVADLDRTRIMPFDDVDRSIAVGEVPRGAGAVELPVRRKPKRANNSV